MTGPASPTLQAITDIVWRLTVGVSSRPVNALGWCVVVLVGVVVVVVGLAAPVSGQDEGQLLTFPWLIAQGSMPYHDIWISYPPGVFMLLAGLFKLGCTPLLTERLLGTLARGLLLLLVNKALTQSWWRLSVIGMSMMLCLLAPTGLVAFAWMTGLPLCMAGILVARVHPRLACVLFLAAGLFRFEFMLAGCALLATYGLGLRHPASHRGALASLVLATGCVYGALSILTHGEAFQDIVIDPTLVIGPGRRLPLIPSQVAPSLHSLIVAILLTPLFIALIGLLFRHVPSLSMGSATAMLLPQFLQRADIIHLLYVACIVLPCAIIALRTLIREGYLTQRTPRVQPMVRSSLVLLLVCIALIVYDPLAPPLVEMMQAFTPSWLTSTPSTLVQVGPRAVIADSAAEARDDRAIVTYIMAHPARRRLAYIGLSTHQYTEYGATFLYYLAGLRPVTPFMDMEPGLESSALIQRRIIADLHGCPWIILWTGGWKSIIPRGSSLLDHYIQAHYRTVLTTHTYRLLSPRLSKRMNSPRTSRTPVRSMQTVATSTEVTLPTLHAP
jgi:hypothetical protein